MELLPPSRTSRAPRAPRPGTSPRLAPTHRDAPPPVLGDGSLQPLEIHGFTGDRLNAGGGDTGPVEPGTSHRHGQWVRQNMSPSAWLSKG